MPTKSNVVSLPIKKLPSKPGELCELVFQLEKQRAAFAKQEAEVKVQLDSIKELLTEKLKTAGLSGIRSVSGGLELKPSTVAKVVDWGVYLKYIAKNGDFDLVQQRPGITALRARWDAGQEVPGVEKVELQTLKITK